MELVTKFDTWHKTKVGHLVVGSIELLAAYVVGSRAIDTGSWWQYFFTFLLAVGALQNFIRLIMTAKPKQKKRSGKR